VDKDVETLVTALYVKIDDEYRGIKCFGRPPKLSASELLCPAELGTTPTDRFRSLSTLEQPV